MYRWYRASVKHRHCSGTPMPHASYAKTAGSSPSRSLIATRGPNQGAQDRRGACVGCAERPPHHVWLATAAGRLAAATGRWSACTGLRAAGAGCLGSGRGTLWSGRGFGAACRDGSPRIVHLRWPIVEISGRGSLSRGSATALTRSHRPRCYHACFDVGSGPVRLWRPAGERWGPG